MARLRGVGIGAGYFSQFHYEAWSRMADVEIVAICDLDPQRASSTAARFNIGRNYTDFREMLERESPNFVDVISPPQSHLEICMAAAERGIPTICQKPLAPTFAEAGQLVQASDAAGVRLMVHENFRFQPWHREIKRLIRDGVIGNKLHSLTFRSRPGDGWGEGAYLARQPYFRAMPRFLIHETGVHFIDTFRFLAGEIERVHCILRRLNRVIAGEDCGLLIFEFASGAVGVWDANRFNEPHLLEFGRDGGANLDPRFTFGEFLVEGNGGSIRLSMDGTLTVQPLGGPPYRHEYACPRTGFGGDCVFSTQRHFIDRLFDGDPFETEGAEYLQTLAVEEALYESSRIRSPVMIPTIHAQEDRRHSLKYTPIIRSQ